MSKQTEYVARLPDANGQLHFPQSEHEIWQALYKRQQGNLPQFACVEYQLGLKELGLSNDKIPQLSDIDKILLNTTGWRTAAVPALISFEKFFALLANKEFPVATFIRSEDEFDYLREPDIFHEVFGHCPLLTNPSFAHFSHIYGQLGLAASKQDRVFLARLYWFTVEFGLIRNKDNSLQIYGGGILSSPGETLYVMGDKPVIKPFNLVDVLRTPYRIDIMQPVYYAIDSIEYLDEIVNMDIMGAVDEAKKLGLFDPLFEPKCKAS
ncbi:phenylalanine 4-monooxygenase [Shewanella sp. D64]|uniref:phenylalanine 4-monooxygenase n=1 Tax=unclassified Shewanella TaxID=196818 RepID=UPI0022BA2B2E|nr:MULTISPECIES: phenylalanine 4-monooxygenase [unclassified Shewanella]MEC4727781.1 phenylalanine 4-monooxygenase [Shewanella sp. D64]MEC4737544.1 phenylalanine 4-monooxygenase [Shewanella sp. E94]WBJ97353.1 phenylalanine 4-monooxygenase [Shewanella sp. MTB7]